MDEDDQLDILGATGEIEAGVAGGFGEVLGYPKAHATVLSISADEGRRSAGWLTNVSDVLTGERQFPCAGPGFARPRMWEDGENTVGANEMNTGRSAN